MILIIEGIDKVGKSTLQNRLAAEFNLCKLPNPSLLEHTEELEAGIIDHNIKFMEKYGSLCAGFVVDRLHISELVYGKLRRNYESRYFDEFDNRLKALGAIIIYMEPVDFIKTERLHGDCLCKDSEEFDKAIRRTKCEVVKTNYKGTEDLVKWLSNYLS